MSKRKAIKQDASLKDAPCLAKAELTVDEKARLERHEQLATIKPIKIEHRLSDKNEAALEGIVRDDPLKRVKLSEAFGTADADLQIHLMDQVMYTFKGALGADEDGHEKTLDACNKTFAFLAQFQPHNEVEALLAIQMLGVHNSAMDCLQRAMMGGQTFAGRQANVNYASKMTRTFIAQMQALKNYREGGKQQMVVKHIHVNEGGQAIVGQVNQGGGRRNESRE